MAEIDEIEKVKATITNAPNKTDRIIGAAVRTIEKEVGRRKWLLVGGMGKSSSCGIA